MESLKSIKFNHEEENIPLAMGIASDEVESICNRIVELNHETGTITGTVEQLIQEFDGARLAFALMDLGTRLAQSSPLDDLLGMFTE